MKMAHGVTRTVFVFKTFVVKTPTIRWGWRMFLTGLLANMHERLWWNDGPKEKLCPVLYSSRLGTWLVMKYAEDIDFLPPRETFEGLPLDYKRSNFGIIDRKVVLRDYG